MRKTTSALLQSLQYAFQRAQQPNDAENEHFFSEKSNSRRTFLRDAALLSGGMALLPNNKGLFNTKYKIAIVGGGLAGLSAALFLKQKGIRATVYEADKRTGGRIRSMKTFGNNSISTELGGEFFHQDQTDLMNLVRALGLERDLLDMSQDKFGERETYFIGGQKRSLKDIVREFNNALPILLTDTRVTDPKNVLSKAHQLDQLSISAYLEKVPLSNWMKTLIKTAYTAENGLEADEQSALNFLSTIGLEKNSFSIAASNPKQFKINGGNRRITEGLMARVGEQVLVEQKLLAVGEKKGGKIELVFSESGFIKEETFDAVILALPLSILRQMDLSFDMPDLKREAILNLAYGKVAKFALEFNERTWRKANSQGYLTSTDLQMGWDSSHQQNNNKGVGVFTTQVGGYSAANVANANTQEHKDQTKHRLSALEDVFPESFHYFTGKTQVANWTNNEWTRGGFSTFGVGQYATFAGEAQKPVGNIYFAGEHCSADWTGTMNGAVESGRVAAELILKKIGKI